jgi:hypothetical protein
MAFSVFSRKKEVEEDPIVGYVQKQRSKSSWNNPRDYVDRTNEIELRKQREKEEQELALKHVTKNLGKSSEPLVEKKPGFFSRLFAKRVSAQEDTVPQDEVAKSMVSDKLTPEEMAKVNAELDSTSRGPTFSDDLYSLEKKRIEKPKKDIFNFGQYLSGQKKKKDSYFAERRVDLDLRSRKEK